MLIRRLACRILLPAICLAPTGLYAQAETAQLAAEQAGMETVVLKRDTPVHLMTLTEVSTKDHAAGHRFKLRVDQPVAVQGKVVLPVGTLAWGEVVDARSSGRAGKSGKLSVQLLHVDLDGQLIPIEATIDSKGLNGTRQMVVGAMALGPLALFAPGNNAKVKAGERVVAFVAEDTVVGPRE